VIQWTAAARSIPKLVRDLPANVVGFAQISCNWLVKSTRHGDLLCLLSCLPLAGGKPAKHPRDRECEGSMARSRTARKGRWLRRHGVCCSRFEQAEGSALDALSIGENLYNGAQAERS
jgi:hypothetical protein